MHFTIPDTPKAKKIATVIMLLSIMLLGLFFRTDDLRQWQKQPNRAFFLGEPLLTTFDGYFYLNLSRELLNDTYDEVDEKQVVPQGRKRPVPPPLLSVLGAFVAKITGVSLNWVAVFLPPLLGILLALPLFFLGRELGGVVMGGSAALTGVLFPYYIYRSNLGWYDTDCLNVTLVTAFVYLMLRFGKGQGTRRYVYLIASAAVYAIFVWWWDQAFQVVNVICLSVVATTLIVFYRPTRKEGYIFYGTGGALLLLALVWNGGEIPVRIYHSVVQLFDYVHTSKSVAGVFPSHSVTVSEQVRPGFSDIVHKSTGSLPVFIGACAGLLYLFCRKPKDSLSLITLLIMASLSFLFAKRFLIFLNPITAIGIGSTVAFVWSLRLRYKIAALLAPGLLVIFLWPVFRQNMTRTHWPKEPSFLVAGMAEAKKHTPEDAVIWTWWDHGYNMRYWADRGVIADGSYHGGQISLYNALPLTMKSDRAAANFMRFFVTHGSRGMSRLFTTFQNDHTAALNFVKRAFALGHEGYLASSHAARLAPDGKTDLGSASFSEFLFPRQGKPVYLFIDWRLISTAYWWYWFGSWDFDKREGVHPVFDLFSNVTLQSGFLTGRHRRFGTVKMDLKSGKLLIGKKRALVSHLTIFQPDGNVRTKRYGSKGVALNVNLAKKAASIVGPNISPSLFNRLFVQRLYDKRFFRLVAEEFPGWQLWQVKWEDLGQRDTKEEH